MLAKTIHFLFIWIVFFFMSVALWGADKENLPVSKTEPYAPSYGPWTSSRLWGGGSIMNVVFCPSAPNRLYSYSDVCGPFRSDDCGKTWYNLQGAIPECVRMAPRSISVDPCNADNIIVAGGAIWWLKGGVYVSCDGGKTFQKKVHARFYDNGVRRRMGFVISRDPFNPDIVSAASDCDGVWQTCDNGQSWHNVGLKNIYPSDLRYDCKVRNRIYLSAPRWSSIVYERTSQQKEYGNVKRDFGFFRSDDNGKIWQKISGEAPTEVVQSISHPERIYGIFDERIIRLSTDGGNIWKDCSEGLPVLADMPVKVIQDSRYNMLAAGPNFILAGNTCGDIFRLDDNSGTWHKIIREKINLNAPDAGVITPGRFGQSQTSISIDPVNPKHWFMTDWFTIWETNNAGKTWANSQEGISQLCMYMLACDPDNPKRVYIGMADNALGISNDGGESFQLDEQYGRYVTSLTLDSPNKLLYFCGGMNNVIGVKKAGKPIVKISGGRGLPDLKMLHFAAYTVAVNPTNGKVYVCISGPVGPDKGGVYESSNHGESWKWIGAGLPHGRDLFKNYIYDGLGPELVISSDGTMVCISKRSGDVYYWNAEINKWESSKLLNTSDKAGSNFSHGGEKDVNTGRDHWKNIAADPYVPGRFLSSSSSKGLFISEDGGKTFKKSWELVGQIGNIAFDQRHKGRVFANTNHGILLSDDGGNTWIMVPGYDRIPTFSYRKGLYVHYNRLFIIDPDGSGVYWMDLPENLRR